MSLQRETISTTEEKRIVLGLIVSTEFIQEIEPIFRLDYFKNSYLRTVAEWSHSFYEEYKKAPFIHIKDIFNSEKHQLPETDTDLIEILLTDLDSKYSEGEINLKYWVEECTDYFRKRELEIVVNNISVLSSQGDLVSAENEIARFKKVSLDIGYKSIIKISDLNTQEELYRKRDQEEANFFNLPGDLGKYLGNQKRGDVVGYFGPAKRGKCLPGDNLIYLSDGTIKTLKEVVEQKIEGVLSKDANNHFVSDTITNWVDCGIKQEFTVTTKSRRKIKTSKEHHFFTPYGWKPLHELKVGDNVALAKKIAPECTSSVPEKELIWDTITSIKAGKLVSMYDLTVKNNHNFIANSFVVHNSWTLLNNFKYGILSKKKTLFFSIEMTDTEVLPRVNQSFFPMIDKDDGEQYFPAFDCVHNQNGSCADRMSPTVVLEGGEAVPDPSHIPCTKCKGDGSFRYKVAVYQDKMFRYKNDIFEVRKNHKKYKGMWEKYARIACHPKYSLTYDLILSDIDALWKKEMWFPDILIIDYIDILQIPSKFDDYRLEDEKWKLLAKIAGQTNTLVITATQANKAGHVAGTLDSTHQGGFYGKNRHVNLMVGLNQTPQNKKDGIMEFGITEARSVDYIPGRLCTVLQDYKTGQAYLDSYYDVNQILKIGG